MLKVFALIGLTAISAPAFATPRKCETGGAPLMNGVTSEAIARSIAVPVEPRETSTKGLLDVGARISSHQRIKAVNATLAKALPQYAGYGYFLAKHDIVIVHRPTRRVAYILPFCR